MRWASSWYRNTMLEWRDVGVEGVKKVFSRCRGGSLIRDGPASGSTIAAFAVAVEDTWASSSRSDVA